MNKKYRHYNNYRRRNNSGILPVVLYFVLMAVFVAADQVTKLLAVRYLSHVGSVPVIGNYLRFSYAENAGAAFSIMQGKRIILIAVPAVISVVCAGFLVSRKLRSVLGNIALTLVCAGGIGNLIDRVKQGYVIDFVDVNVIHFAIFNVADSCVTIGVILLAIVILTHETGAGRRKSRGGLFTGRRI